MKQLSLIFLAAFNSGGEGGWIFDLFRSVRMEAIKMSSLSVSLAMAVASIIVVFKLVLVSKNLMSDEQGSGFGQIKMWSVIRPIVILILISSTPKCLGLLDDMANSISIGVTNSVTKKDIKAEFGAAAAIQNKNIKEKTTFDVENLEANQAVITATTDLLNASGLKFGAKTIDLIMKQRSLNKAVDKAVEEMSKAQMEKNGEEMTREQKASVAKYLKQYYKSASGVSVDDDHAFDLGNGMFLPGICVLIYDLLFKVIQCFAELALCVLAVLAPWVMVFALFDSNKGAIINYGLRYIQISFWKVIAAVINFAVVTAAYANHEYQAKQALAAIEQAMSGSTSIADEVGVHIGGGITITTIMCIAGIFALLKVSDMAQAIIPTSGGSFGDLGGAGAGFAAGTAKGAAQLPGKAATVITGHTGKKTAAKNAQATQQFQQNVSKNLSNIGKQVSSMGKS